MYSNWARVFSWFLIISTVIGCGAKKTVKVEGVVKVDGAPAPGIVVKFVNQDGGRDADGYTDDKGVFHLTTFNTNDGAMPGSYKVVVKMSDSSGENVPAAGGDLSRPPNMVNAMKEFSQNQRKVTGPPKSGLPDVYGKADSTPLKFQIPYDGKIEIEISSKAGK
jgi:hypothetical protein